MATCRALDWKLNKLNIEVVHKHEQPHYLNFRTISADYFDFRSTSIESCDR